MSLYGENLNVVDEKLIATIIVFTHNIVACYVIMITMN